MNAGEIWHNMPRQLVAILRGLQPGQTEAVTIALIEAGFRAIEVPLNRPDAMAAIEIAVRTAESFGESCLVGAGTVLSASAVKQVQGAGGNLVVAPNHDPAVVRAARAACLATMPGVFTATEAQAALADGATALKFFPASALGLSGVAAIATILPEDASICAVGGVGAADFGAWMTAGISGFGIGSSLYRPGWTAAEIGTAAEAMVTAYDAAREAAGAAG